MNNPYALDYQLTETIFDNLEYFFQEKIDLNKDINSNINKNTSNSNNLDNSNIVDISNNILQLIKNLKLIEK
jgi:hypothetical protein